MLDLAQVHALLAQSNRAGITITEANSAVLAPSLETNLLEVTKCSTMPAPASTSSPS
jgi:hypothetical protein